MIQTYAIPINPEPWAVGNAYVRRAGGKSFAAVAPDKTLKSYKEALAAELIERGATVMEGPYELRFWFWRENITYIDEGGKKRTRNSPDATNMQKATEDALQGVLIENDRDVLSISSTIVERGQGVDPMVVVQVVQIDESHLRHGGSTNAEVDRAIRLERERAEKIEADKESSNTWIPGQ